VPLSTKEEQLKLQIKKEIFLTKLNENYNVFDMETSLILLKKYLSNGFSIVLGCHDKFHCADTCPATNNFKNEGIKYIPFFCGNGKYSVTTHRKLIESEPIAQELFFVISKENQYHNMDNLIDNLKHILGTQTQINLFYFPKVPDSASIKNRRNEIFLTKPK
jgi:hypothetical protein